jgi:hypothetical protein
MVVWYSVAMLSGDPQQRWSGVRPSASPTFTCAEKKLRNVKTIANNIKKHFNSEVNVNFTGLELALGDETTSTKYRWEMKQPLQNTVGR